MTLVARIGALSDIGLHRKTNEDAFVTAAPLFAVCDGMGGALAGEVASALAAETLAAGVARGDSLLGSAEAANAAKISGCWRTLATLQRHCRIRSYLATARSHAASSARGSPGAALSNEANATSASA